MAAMALSLWMLVCLMSIFLGGISVGSEKTECVRSGSLQVQDVLIVVQSQKQAYHVKLANALRPAWRLQLAKEKLHSPLNTIMTHEDDDEDMEMAWAVFPLLSVLGQRPQATNAKWIFFIEDATEILSFGGLLKKLQDYDECEPHFIGRGLFDRTVAIIHHFAFANSLSEFLFPDFAAGWLLSGAMLRKITERMRERRIEASFTIDVQHELAKYMYDEFDKQNMTSVDWLCAGQSYEESQRRGCVTNFDKGLRQCKRLTVSDVYFGVKTTEMFHKTRLPVLLDTWGQPLVNKGRMVLYSNITDRSIPTVDCGIPNTERGHCGKLYAIMRAAVEQMAPRKTQWLVVTDDDTLMSVPRLLTLLSCYDSSSPMALGEVYGYAANAGHGYGYLTGGGGFVLSLPAVERLVTASEHSVCGCPQHDSPDDMYLGMCMRALKIPVVHRPEFHQARPDEYSDGYLERQTPVSFHRHSFHNPYDAYNTYLGGAVEVKPVPVSADEYEDLPLAGGGVDDEGDMAEEAADEGDTGQEAGDAEDNVRVFNDEL